MAKKESTSVEVLDKQPNGQVAEVPVKSFALQNLEEIAASMEEMEEGIEMTSDYLKLEIDEEVRIAPVGMVRINSDNSEDEDGKVDAVRFLKSDATFGIAANAVLVSTLSKAAQRFEADPKPENLQFFNVRLLDKEDRGKGRFLYNYSVKQLLPPTGKTKRK